MRTTEYFNELAERVRRGEITNAQARAEAGLPPDPSEAQETPRMAAQFAREILAELHGLDRDFLDSISDAEAISAAQGPPAPPTADAEFEANARAAGLTVEDAQAILGGETT